MRTLGGRDERDLEEALRAELAAVEPQRACCRAAERVGLGRAARGQARSPAVARLAVRLEEHGRGSVQREPGDWSDQSWAAAREHCRAAYLRGRFLAAGSVSVARATHVEFVVEPDEAPVLARRLGEAGFPASVRTRRGRGVVTWKSTETVLSFLRSAGASTSVLELEARLVTRQMRAHLNRVLNAETANLARSVAATARQLAAIDSLDASGRLAELSESDRLVARARQAAPEASFTELAISLGISRPRLQRALDRLVSTAATAETEGRGGVRGR